MVRPGLRRALRIAGRALAGIVVAGLLAIGLTRTGRYLVRAGWEEAKILLARRDIAAIVGDPSVAPAVRGKLQLVLDARRFAVDSVGLDAGESFTQYTRLERDTLVLVLSAAPRDQLRFHSWWFPVVGRVPYKGFFSVEQAQDEARRLEERGMDTYLRPAGAFSTLGWFNDPLLSSTLGLDSLDLSDTVIHELLHNSFYAPGQAVFNESFANFVGARGAAWFFRARGDTAAAAEVERRWADERLLGAFWTTAYNSVDSAFAVHAGDDDEARRRRVAARDSVFGRLRRQLIEEVGPQLVTRDASLLHRTRFDNAMLLGRRIYLTDLGLFEEVHEREGGDLRRTIARVTELARSREDDPYAALREWLGPAVIAGGDSSIRGGN